jgi:hypothetical protein
MIRPKAIAANRSVKIMKVSFFYFEGAGIKRRTSPTRAVLLFSLFKTTHFLYS